MCNTYGILLVEDEQYQYNALVKRLNMQGIETVGVHDAWAAASQMAERGFDVALIDLMIPWGDTPEEFWQHEHPGIALVEGIRAGHLFGCRLQINPEVPILVPTAVNRGDYAHLLDFANVFAFPKPFSPVEMMSKIEDFLRPTERTPE